jgi:hypothetical protein
MLSDPAAIAAPSSEATERPPPSPRPTKLSRHLGLARHRLAVARQAKARIAYLGLDGGGNLGDDAMRELVEDRLAGCRLEPLTSAWLERRLCRAGLSGPRYFSAGLLGGGTLISPSEFERTRGAVDTGIAMWAVGTGVGSSGFEMTGEVDISAWRPVLERFAYVGVRGPRSARRLAELGVESEVVGDLALGLAVDRALTPAHERPTIAVNLGGSPGAVAEWSVEEDVLAAAASALRPLADAGWRIVPFAMAPGDMPVLERLQSLLGSNSVVLRPRTAAELMATLASCRMTLAMRLHAAVLSACAGVPPLMLAYRDKCADFMDSVEMTEWTLDPHRELSGLPARLDKLEARADRLRAPLLARAQELGRRSHGRLAALHESSLVADA